MPLSEDVVSGIMPFLIVPDLALIYGEFFFSLAFMMCPENAVFINRTFLSFGCVPWLQWVFFFLRDDVT